jgi:tetratricopeptide (TPR) repeat protein
MNRNELNRLFIELEDQDFSFSTLIILREILKIENSEYNRFKVADQLRCCGYYTESLKIYKSINVKKIPSEYLKNFYLYYAQLFHDMGDYKNAKKYYVICIKNGINDTMPFIFLSSIYLKEQKIKDAIQILKSAINKKGDIDEVFFNLGAKYAILGKNNIAIKYLKKCLQIDSNYPNAQNLINDLSKVNTIKQLIKSESK